LIINAIEASPDGATVRTRVKKWESKIVIEVEDSGPGIKADVQHCVFEAFYTTKTDIGTGLGLWVSRQLVERAGGTISFESKIGVGTRFIVQLPEIDSGREGDRLQRHSGN
jgi:signal transduction histidine kinase